MESPTCFFLGRPSKIFIQILSMWHVWTHGFQRLYETVRLFYSDVNELISNGEKILRKCPSRIHKFETLAPGVSLPPRPIVTRKYSKFPIVFLIFKLCKGTWLDSAKYYTDYFDNMYEVIFSLEEDDAASIGIAQGRLTKPNIKSQLTYICANFLHLKSAILELEKKGYLLFLLSTQFWTFKTIFP